MVGMELRDKVSSYVKERIGALRRENAGQYGNITCVRTNAMKYLPHYFEKGQLTKMFFLFPVRGLGLLRLPGMSLGVCFWCPVDCGILPQSMAWQTAKPRCTECVTDYVSPCVTQCGLWAATHAVCSAAIVSHQPPDSTDVRAHM